MKSLVRFVHKILSALLFLVPRKLHVLAGRFLGSLWFDVLRVRRDIVLSNLQIAFPEKTSAERVKIGRQAMHIIGQNIFDVLVMPFFSKRWAERDFEFFGLENVEAALEKEKGVLFLTLHLGTGDLATAALNYQGVPVNLISKEFKSQWLNNFWFRVRGRHGTKFIAPRKSTFDILRALKRNESVVFVLDQYMGPPLGVRTKFFSRETGTAMGLALLAGRTQTPVLPIYTFMDKNGRSKVIVEKEILWQDKSPREVAISHMTQVYTDKIEEIVRTHPDQWLWVHRRWKEFKD